MNSMLVTIVGLLEETRQQRDALAGAAEHLFSDMRIVNAGDLRVSATVSNDPIGMLANAFNFTVGRFRRFILRTQTTIEQLDVVSRQALERSNAFISLVRAQLRDLSSHQAQPVPAAPVAQPGTDPLRPGLRRTLMQPPTGELDTPVQQVQQAQQSLLQETRDDLNRLLNTTREAVEKASLSIGRLSELVSTRSGSHSINVTEKMVQAQLQELVGLEQLLGRLAREIRQTQFSVTTNFVKLDTAGANLARAAAGRLEPIPPQVPVPTSLHSEAQYQEFVRQAGSFAVEVNALSKRLTTIIQEMRTGIAPFRLEGTAVMGEPAKAIGGQPANDQFFSPVSSNSPSSGW